MSAAAAAITGAPTAAAAAAAAPPASSSDGVHSVDGVELQETCETTAAFGQDGRSGGRRLCWWCCCSGSKSTRISKSNSRPQCNSHANRDQPSDTDFRNIPREEIESWSDCFENVMGSYDGRRVFREFLKSEYSEENIMFWLVCEELKQEQRPDRVEEKARCIYEDYISILSPKEVSLDSRVREVINKSMVEPTAHTFDDAQTQIFTLMKRDSYPRFVNSQLYQNLLKGRGTS